MRANQLIRTIGGAEVPAPGSWQIPRGHVTVSYTGRIGVLRRMRAQAPSATGTLDVSEDSAALELTIAASPRAGSIDAPGLGGLLGADDAPQVELRAPALVPTPHGIWRTSGQIRIGRSTQAVPVTVTYHGVYRSGDTAKAWLTVHATAEGNGRRLHGPVELVADVLAVAPSPTAAAG